MIWEEDAGWGGGGLRGRKRQRMNGGVGDEQGGRRTDIEEGDAT